MNKVASSKIGAILLCSLFLVGCEASPSIHNFDIQLSINKYKVYKGKPRCVRNLLYRRLQIEACEYIWEDFLTEEEKLEVKLLRGKMR